MSYIDDQVDPMHLALENCFIYYDNNNMIIKRLISAVSAFCVFWCASQPHLLHHLEQNLMATLTTKYRGDYATDPVSVAWNWVQSSAKKCGVRGTRDWLTSNWYKSQSDPSKRTMKIFKSVKKLSKMIRLRLLVKIL